MSFIAALCLKNKYLKLEKRKILTLNSDLFIVISVLHVHIAQTLTLYTVSRIFHLILKHWSAAQTLKLFVMFRGLGSHPARHMSFNTILTINPKWQIRVTEILTVTWGISRSAIRGLRAKSNILWVWQKRVLQGNQTDHQEYRLLGRKPKGKTVSHEHEVWFSDWWCAQILTCWTDMTMGFNKDFKALLNVVMDTSVT